MELKEYSASTMTYRFWFAEFIILIDLLNKGYSSEEIKQKNIDENLFNANSTRRAREIANALLNRLNGINNSFIELFLNSNLETRKILCLLTCLKEDRLMFECVSELIRPNILNKYFYFTQKDLFRFFDLKSTQNEKIAGWAPSTIQKIRSVYTGMLTESGIVRKHNDKFIINIPKVNEDAKSWIKENDFENIYEALTGEVL